jgi:FMN-dependent NADH-azoreductase
MEKIMGTLLHIDSSAATDGSVSRKLTSGFVAEWLRANPDYTVRYRDLAAQPLPGVTGDLLGAMYAPAGTELSEAKKAALAHSDSVVDEFLEADLYVFGVPMYNFSVPAAFKAYIDQVVRMGKTMGVGPNGLTGMVKGKKLLIISTRSGDYGKGGPRDGWDFHEPYVRKFFGWLGIEDITYIPVINNARHGDAETQLRRQAETQDALDATAERWREPVESELKLTV